MTLAAKMGEPDILDAMRGIESVYMKVAMPFDCMGADMLGYHDKNGLWHQYLWPVDEIQAEVDAGRAKWADQ